jgi:hypothetical protein
MPSPSKSSPPKRFRPTPAAIANIRPYKPAATSSGSTSKSAASRKRRSAGSSRVGRFIRRYGDGRLATESCEAALKHIVGVFAAEVAKLASELRTADSRATATATTEEGDVRRVLARLQGGAPPPQGRDAILEHVDKLAGHLKSNNAEAIEHALALLEGFGECDWRVPIDQSGSAAKPPVTNPLTTTSVAQSSSSAGPSSSARIGAPVHLRDAFLCRIDDT